MSDRLPVQVDPIRLAQQGRSFEGQIPLAKLPRLVELLLSADGEIEVKLDFRRNERGRLCVTGVLQTELQLECQRCLEAMPLRLDDHFELVLVESEAEVESLGEDGEVLIVESTPLLLNDIVEDELILSLPQVAMHSNPACEPAVHLHDETEFEEHEPAEEEKPNPFAVLSELKRKDD